MTPAYPSLLLPLICGLLSAFGTWAILPALRRHVMDMPNARSNHKAPVPRGGGIAMILAALIGLTLAGFPLAIALAALVLAVISFIDDVRGLPVGIRLGAQLIAVIVSVNALPGRILPDFIPYILEYITLVLAWIWFINLTNFMDGIDGISAMQAILVSTGIALLYLICPLPHTLSTQAGVMAASAFGFYLFNRSPAKLFMGDVGSIPLGLLMGYLLLSLAAYGYLLSALILPAYYLTDATWTLLKRLYMRQKVWEAHSQHAYQQAVRSGLAHAQVVERIARLNIALIVLAMGATVSMMAGIICTLAAYGITCLLIRRFNHVPAIS